MELFSIRMLVENGMYFVLYESATNEMKRKCFVIFYNVLMIFYIL